MTVIFSSAVFSPSSMTPRKKHLKLSPVTTALFPKTITSSTAPTLSPREHATAIGRSYSRAPTRTTKEKGGTNETFPKRTGKLGLVASWTKSAAPQNQGKKDYWLAREKCSLSFNGKLRK